MYPLMLQNATFYMSEVSLFQMAHKVFQREMTLEIFAKVLLNLFQVLFGLGFLSDTHRAIYKNKYDILLLFDRIKELEVTIKKKRGTYYVV